MIKTQKKWLRIKNGLQGLNKGIIMYYIVSLLALCLFCSTSEASLLNFDNLSPVSYSIEERLQVTGKARGLSSKASVISTIEFDLTLQSLDEATLTIRAIDSIQKKTEGKKAELVITGKNPKNKPSKLLTAAFDQLRGAELHFVRDQEGKMVETTGL